MIKLEFSSKVKLWPRFDLESFEKLLENITTPSGDIVLREFPFDENQGDVTLNEKKGYTFAPFIYALGGFKGSLFSLKLTENAFRDNLKHTTKLGNLWSVISFSINLIFFVGLITLSGGANPTLDIQAIIAMFGAWLIFEIAFVRGIFSSFKFGPIESRLGINPKLVVIGMFSTIWMELLALLIVLNVWSIFNFSKLMTFEACIGLLLCLLCLLLLGYPYSYFISQISRRNIDMRFVTPVAFRFIVFTTPLFYSFHQNYPSINRVLDYSPLNFCFNFLESEIYWSTNEFLYFAAFTLVSYSLLLYRSGVRNRSIWIDET